MMIDTILDKTKYSEYIVKVHTRNATYSCNGAFYTCLSMTDWRGVRINLISGYTNSEQEASDYHLALAQKAKELLDLQK